MKADCGMLNVILESGQRVPSTHGVLDLAFKSYCSSHSEKAVRGFGQPLPQTVSVAGVRLHLSLHKDIWLYMDRVLFIRSFQTFFTISIHNISFPSKMSFQDFSDIQEKYFCLTEKLWIFFFLVKYNLEHIVNAHISCSTSFRREIPTFFY